MKKSKRMLRKFLLILSSALLLVSLTVGATVAYLTDTESVTNTFTVGNVQIKLDEAITAYNQTANKWEAKNDGSRTTGTNVSQTYKLLPGTIVDKDPTVYIAGGSEAAYIRILVKVNDISKLTGAFNSTKYPAYYDGNTFLLQSAVTDWDATKWPCYGITTNANEVTYEFRYYITVDGSGVAANEYKSLEPLFETVVIPGTLNNTEIASLQGVSFNITAEAIQAAGFANADAAWIAFNNQHPATTPSTPTVTPEPEGMGEEEPTPDL